MPKSKKILSYKFGLFSETIAATLLRLKGYSILARRYKTRVGEIDLIVRRGKQLVFVEVKGRSTIKFDVVQKRQQERVSRAASLFIAKQREFANLYMRFDVIVVVPWQMPRHIENAW